MKLTGADILIRCLKEQGVETVFGYPGGCVLDIYDAIYRDGTLKHILTAHEQGAAHAADGYAARRAKRACASRLPAPGRPTSLQVSPRRIWIPFPSSPLRAT